MAERRPSVGYLVMAGKRNDTSLALGRKRINDEKI